MKTPRNLHDALYRIAKLEEENEAMSDALNKVAEECAIVLSNKDREMEEKCKKCQRGMRR